MMPMLNLFILEVSTFSLDLSSNHAGHHNQHQRQPVEANNCSDTDSIHSLVQDVEILIADEEGKGRFQNKLFL